MQPELRVYLTDKEERFFGIGPYRLLRGVAEHGSLRSAAQDMDMSYSKALRIIRRAEEALGCELTSRAIGGKNGGGSRLTAEAVRLLRCYEFYEESCAAYAKASFERFFAEILSGAAPQENLSGQSGEPPEVR